MGLLKRVTAPFRNYLNNHFEMVKQEVRQQRGQEMATLDEIAQRIGSSRTEVHNLGVGLAEAMSESQQFVGRQLAEIRQHSVLGVEVNERVLAQLERLDVADARLAEQHDRMWSLLTDSGLAQLPERVEDIGPRDRALLNRWNSHDGYRSEVGVWVNEPLSVGFEGQTLQVNDVNERVCEIPFVLAAVAALPTTAHVIDIGCCESPIALHLASLGYQVTALDPRPYPFSHQNITVVEQSIEDYQPTVPVDAAILLSTIEHIGIGSYGLDRAERLDLAAMSHVRSLLGATGLLVLTTPFGTAAVNELERTYDVAGVHELLEGFEMVGSPRVMVRLGRTEWIPDELGFVDVIDDRPRVVMVTARPQAA